MENLYCHLDALCTESDVEQKFLYKLLSKEKPLGLGYSDLEIATKQNIKSYVINKGKQQKIYISSNYEAYIGSEFVSSAKLDSLYEIMRSTNVKTIGQALMVYDERK